MRALLAGFIAPCLPTKTDKLPSGSQWLHEIKHDGFRIIARKNGDRVKLYSRPGNDLTRRFPLIVETLARLRSLAERRGAEAAARETNQTLDILTARNESEIVATFASLKERRIGALIIGSDSFYLGQMRWMAALAAHNEMPAIGPSQEFTAAGGLMNYGPSIADGARQVGVYVGKVLKGARPADLPVVQPTKFELAINLKAAKALGLDVPQTLLAIADEVIE